MKKVSLLLSALLLVGGVSFAGVKEKKEKKAKTESCAKGGSCCAKKGKDADKTAVSVEKDTKEVKANAPQIQRGKPMRASDL